MVSIDNTPLGRRGGHERFARAVDAVRDPAETSFEQERRSQPPTKQPPAKQPPAKQPPTNDSFDKHADEEMAGELATVALLREAAERLGPDPAARQRMYERVLAGRDGREPAPHANTPAGARPATAAGRAGKGPSTATRRGNRHFIRSVRAAASAHIPVVAASAAVLCLLLSVSGMSLFLSRDALPGDALYGIKRSAETASLGLTFGEGPKAFKHMRLATARVDEIKTLDSRRQVRGAASAKDDITALVAFNPEAAAASQLLTRLGTDGDGRLLNTLRDWAQAQSTRLTTVQPGLPPSALSHLTTTLDLLSSIQQRSTALLDRVGCTSVTSGASDEIGALPATDYCTAAPPGHKTAADPRSSSSAVSPRTDVRGTQPTSGQAPPPGSPDQPSAGTQPPPTSSLLGPRPTAPRSTPPTRPPAPGGIPTVVIPLPVPPIDLPFDGLLGLPRIHLGP